MGKMVCSMEKNKILSCFVLAVLVFASQMVFGFNPNQKNVEKGKSTFRKPLYPEENRPNILLILSDDHSFPFLGCYGYEDLNTPNLDKLANDGIRFENAYTYAPQCVPSRATILSGRNVIDIEMSRFSAPLPHDVKTIPEYLREVGYYTGICGRHYHLDGSARMPLETADAFKKYDLITFPNRVDYLKVGSDDKVLDQFQEFLTAQPANKPFFMWMNYSDPHRPFTAKEFEPDPDKITVPDIFPDTQEVRKDLSEHLGEINRLDYYIGQVLEELKKRKLRENTVIIFMGDNGAALLRGKGTLYDVGIHIPLVVNGAQVKNPGSVSKALISGIDIAPTILEIAGVEKSKAIMGKSFNPIIKGKSFRENEYIFATRVPHSSGLPENTAYFDLSRTVFNHHYKLIYNALWQLPYSPVDFGGSSMWHNLVEKNKNGELESKFQTAFFSEPRPMFELFDLINDPGEFNNLSGNKDLSEIEHQLKAVLHEWMIINQDYLPLPIPPPKK
jgi:arylsulfatase A-like enzyme